MQDTIQAIQNGNVKESLPVKRVFSQHGNLIRLIDKYHLANSDFSLRDEVLDFLSNANTYSGLRHIVDGAILFDMLVEASKTNPEELVSTNMEGAVAIMAFIQEQNEKSTSNGYNVTGMLVGIRQYLRSTNDGVASHVATERYVSSALGFLGYKMD